MDGRKQRRDLLEQVLRMLCLPQQPAGADGPLPGSGWELEMTQAFTSFMDEIPGGFLIYHADQGEEVIYANQALLRMFQCGTMEEFRAFTGNSFRGMVYPEDLEEVEESIRAQIAASQYDLDYVEYRIRRKDGAVRWIEDYGHFLHLEQVGDIFYVFLGDATEKRDRIMTEKTRLVNEKLAGEQKLQTLIEEYDKERSLINQEYLRRLEVIEGLSVNYESICYVDLDIDQIVPYRLSVRTSPLFHGRLQPQQYTKYNSDYVEAWVHPEDREAVLESVEPDYIREKLSAAKTYYVNYRVLVKEEQQYIQLRVVNVGRSSGVSQVVLGYRRIDAELQRQMEQQALLAEALAKANLAINSKNTFLSNMSHDMRTPLQAIFGFTSLAKLNLNRPEEAAGYLERVESASRQLLDMIDKLLEMSALSGSAGVEEAECDLKEVLGEVHAFLQPRTQEKSIAFTLDCGRLRHGAVYADREKLRQLILYLANNAITYTKPGGEVTISAVEGEELSNQYTVYRLSVADNGIGISPEFLDEMFKPFTREQNSTLSGVHGVGLGLTIAKNIADMMGGTMDVQSEVGRGSTFTASFTFRVQGRNAGAPERAGRWEGPQRILLVEDNEINREIETELLERLNFVVEPAENGKIALEKMRKAAPGDYDLILMDLQMPVMNGWETAVAIRALPDPALARTPIIALSANMLESDRRRSKGSGIDAHLLKPMDLPLLLRTIQELTGGEQPA